MKHLTGYGCIAMVAGALVGSFAVAENLSSSDKSRLSLKMEEMMKKVEDAGTPGAGHKALEPLIGTWNAEVKTWMEPGGPPTITRAAAKSAWILKGRFVQQEFNGEFMGKSFRGLSFTGYDNMKKKFTSVWIDDMNTTMFTSEGEATDNNKTITLGGSYDCPLTGEKGRQSKQVYRIISHDKHVYEMHDPGKGPNSKTMEITYTRK